MKANLQTHFEQPVFMGLSPPNMHCFLAQVRMRYYKAMYDIIRSARLGDSSKYEEGLAAGMVCVLYDANTSDAYTKLQRLSKVQNLVAKLRNAQRPTAVR